MACPATGRAECTHGDNGSSTRPSAASLAHSMPLSLSSETLCAATDIKLQIQDPAPLSRLQPDYDPETVRTLLYHNMNETPIANLHHSAWMGGLFGIAAGTGLLLFLDAIPKVQTDILQKMPFIAKYFTKEIPPEDNPF